MTAPDPTVEREPCYGCSCCELWQQALQLLRDHIKGHTAGEVRLGPCEDECLVCGEIDWQSPQVLDDDQRAEIRRRLLAGIEPV